MFLGLCKLSQVGVDGVGGHFFALTEGIVRQK